MERALAAAIGLAAALAGCGGGDEDGTRIPSGPLTIYSSVPRHGLSAGAGEAVYAGQRRALQDAGGRAGGRRVRLVRLSSTRPQDSLWDPGTVEANAERARDDPSAVAYLGEFDHGGSAISLPVTNGAELLQVSPADGLTSLTRTPPGRPRAGPERYYPARRRTFVRVVPSDLVVAERLLAVLERRGLDRLAVLHGEGIADRELAAVVVNRLRTDGHEPAAVEPLPDEDDAAPALVERLAASRPEAVVHAGPATSATRATLAALAGRLPAVPVIGSAGLAAEGALGRSTPREVQALTAILPAGALPPAGRRVLGSMRRDAGAPVRPEALYGYESMLLALEAIDEAGPDRRAVARAALAPRRRRSVLGRAALSPHREVRPRRLALMDLSGGRRVLQRVVR